MNLGSFEMLYALCHFTSKFLSLVSSVHALYFMEDVLILTSLSEFWENWTEDLKWGAYDADGGVFQQTDGFISRTLWGSCVGIHRTCDRPVARLYKYYFLLSLLYIEKMFDQRHI